LDTATLIVDAGRGDEKGSSIIGRMATSRTIR